MSVTRTLKSKIERKLVDDWRNAWKWLSVQIGRAHV